jgi:two-component system response regulator FixJ
MQIYIVDDDADLQISLSFMLSRAGHEVQGFHLARPFLSVASDLPAGCILLDLCLPDIDGLTVQAHLQQMDSPHAVILLTGFGDVPDAVAAMRAGALDFLRKPFRRGELFAALDRAEENLALRRTRLGQDRKIANLDALSPRERDVLWSSAGGAASKQVAYALGLSVRTVEMHRANVIKKLGVSNFGAALLLAQRSGFLNPQ